MTQIKLFDLSSRQHGERKHLTTAQVTTALEQFERQHQRAPRVLCIGNVANNGYNNGKILARAGWDIDVLCYDYYHIMGCPEWEDADFAGDYGDPFHPNWARVDLRGFKRPAWFVQGPRSLCVRYLIARRENRPWLAAFYGAQLRYFEHPAAQFALRTVQRSYRFLSGKSPHIPLGRFVRDTLRTTKRVAIFTVMAPLALLHDGLFLALNTAVRLNRKLREWWNRCRGKSHIAVTADLPWKGVIQRSVNERVAMFHSVSDALHWQMGQFAYLARTTRAVGLNLLAQCENGIARRVSRVGRAFLSQLPLRVRRPTARVAFESSLRLQASRAFLLRLAALVEHGLGVALRFLFNLVVLAITAPWKIVANVVLGLVAMLGFIVRGVVGAIAPSTSPIPGATPAAVRIPLPDLATSFQTRIEHLVSLFGELFPERADQLETADMIGYQSLVPEWQRLMSHYDLVIGYSTDGIYPLLMGKRPYVAYEHGTIRGIPFEPNPVGRTCALTYRLADAVVITNCDCDVAAEKLELDNHRFIPHPINEDWLADNSWLAVRHELRERMQSDFIIFHPSRQHWEPERHPSWEKGNDFLIRGFARFVHEICPTAAMVCVAWGKTLQQSKDLLAELGVADRVLWVDPMPTVRMTRYMRACDVIADQFYLGAFGGIMPKAMIYGRPTLIYLNEERHHWCFPEMPPICNTRTDDDVFEALRRLRVEPNYMQNMIDDGLRWYAKYHSSQLVAQRFDDILGEVLNLNEQSPVVTGELRRCA